MGIAISVILVITSIALFVAVTKGWLSRKSVELAAQIAGIIAMLAAIVVIIIPLPSPANSPSPTIVAPSDTIPTSVPTSKQTMTLPSTPLPSSTPNPTATSTSAPTVATASETPKVLATRVLMPTATATPCSIQVGAAFVQIWNDSAIYSRLRCPITNSVTRESVEESFERGHMVWRGGGVQVYVIYQDGTWDNFPKSANDILQESTDPEYFCGTHSSPPSPRRGFSKIWCNNPDVRAKIGNATDSEIGFCMPSDCETFQDFEGGITYFSAKYKSTYILFNDKTWQRR